MRKYIFSLLVTAGILATQAADITVTPGNIQDALGSIGAGATTLSLKGAVNAADLYYIADNMSDLKSLDLSGASIEAYSGFKIKYHSEYSANTIPAGAFAGSQLTSVVLPSTPGLTIDEMAFMDTKLTSITLPSNVVKVGESAFSSCKSLKSVTIASAPDFGPRVFAGCTSLENVVLGTTTSISNGMFKGDISLTEIIGTENVTAIGANAFQGCNTLYQFEFGNGLTTIGAHAFENTALTEVILDQATKLGSIGAYAFAKCQKLTTAILPTPTSEMGTGTFMDCSALTEVLLPKSMVVIPDLMLKGAKKLNKTDLIHDGVTTVGRYALKDNSATNAILLPNSIAYLKDGAMEGMTSLNEINATELDSVPSLGLDVWEGVDKSKVLLYVIDNQYESFKSSDQWQDFTIMATNTVAPLPVTDSKSNVKARFEGDNLVVRSSVQNIDMLRLFDARGVLLDSRTPNSTEAVMNTGGTSSRLFIVEVTLADSTVATIKLMK